MTTLREWLQRLWGTFRRGRRDDDLERELRSHLELAAEAGARHAAMGAGLAQAMDAQRDQRGLPWLEDLARDLRYGCRMLAANPGFTIIAAISLAIGVGATCAVFSFADALLLRPLPVPHPSRVVTIGSTDSRRALTASYREYLDIAARSHSFDGIAALTTATPAVAVDADTLPRIRIGMLVTGTFFQVMGVAPALGRTFRPDEDEVPGRDAVLILGHDFWAQQFGADPSVIGRGVRLNGTEFTIIGVAPENFPGLDRYTRFDFYAPLKMWARVETELPADPFEARDYRRLTIKGRLKSVVSLSQARAELAVIGVDLARAYPDTNRDRSMTMRTELQSRIAEVPTMIRLLAMLATLAAAVLFIACANVAGLLTSRAPVRAREIAMRLAIGAGRARLVRQLLTETVLLAGIGSVLGLAVAYAGVITFRQFRIPTELPIAAAFELDRRVLVFSLAASSLSAALVGLGPALRATRADLVSVMKATDAMGFRAGRQWGRALLVAGQVAVSVVLLVVATLLYRGFAVLLDNGPGYRTDRLLQLGFDPTLVGYAAAEGQQFIEQVAERARTMPGVKSVSMASVAPSDVGPSTAMAIVPEGFTFPPGATSAIALHSTADEYYFTTVGLPIVDGRGFRSTDTAGAPHVAVVNEQFARAYWPGQSALGKRFRLSDANGPWIEIVGVAKTASYLALGEAPRPFMYFPYRQRPQPRMTLLVESVGDPASLVAPLREAVRRLDPNQPIYNVRTVEETYRMRMVVIFDILLEVVAAMGIMGLGLAIAGLYGLVAYAASRRTREIGIRMAIGANRASVLLMVVRQGLILAGAGLVVGLVASEGARRALGAIVPGWVAGRGLDVVSFLFVAAVVLAITLLAAYIPARRASHINPTEALRCE